MNKKTIFTGSATALITPIKNGAVDFHTLGSLIERQISNGTDALVICGTTGECATLSDYEHRACISYTIEKANGRVPVIAGTGSNDISYSKSLSRFASYSGADALLVVTPYYNKATSKGLIKSFSEIADASEKPLILYNVPSRTGCNIPLSVYRQLASHGNIAGIKEASGNVAVSERIIAEFGDKIDVYSGNDELTVPIMSVGGKGVISVVSNILPAETHEMCISCLQGDFNRGKKLQIEMLGLIDALFCEINPIPVKTAMEMLGLCSSEKRLPLCEMEDENKSILKKALENYGLI